MPRLQRERMPGPSRAGPPVSDYAETDPVISAALDNAEAQARDIHEEVASRTAARNGRQAGKHWIFTLNNYTESERAALGVTLSTTEVRYAIYQCEIGVNGTPHLQGYIELRRSRRLGSMCRMLPRAHFELRLGTREQARAYCSKEDTRQPGTVPFEFGTWDPGAQGSRSDLREVRDLLANQGVRQTALEHPETFARYPRYFHDMRQFQVENRSWRPYVIVFLGDTGTGKTRKAHELFPSPVWVKPPGPWYDSYEADRYVLLDDFDGKDVPFRFLLQLLDRYYLRVPIKGSFANWVPYAIAITTNLPVDAWYNASEPSLNAPLHRRIDHVFRFPLSDDDSRILLRFRNHLISTIAIPPGDSGVNGTRFSFQSSESNGLTLNSAQLSALGFDS